MSDIKVELTVEIDGHMLSFKEEGHLSPMGHLPSAGRSVERAAIKAQNRAVKLLTDMYGDDKR